MRHRIGHVDLRSEEGFGLFPSKIQDIPPSQTNFIEVAIFNELEKRGGWTIIRVLIFAHQFKSPVGALYRPPNGVE